MFIKVVKPPKIKLIIWGGVFLLQLSFLRIISSYPSKVEAIYSSLFYPYLFTFQSTFFNFFSFSLGDIFYAIAVILLMIYLIRSIIFKRLFSKIILVDLLIAINLIYFFFYLSWGLNYYRIPLYQKLKYDLNYSEAELENTLIHYVQETNILHEKLSQSNDLPVETPYSKTELLSLIKKEYKVPYAGFQASRPLGKNSLWSLTLSYAGYAGYLNPFTLESQINRLLPKLSFVTTAAHEMAHQFGIAAEDEANYIAFYSLVDHSDEYLRFAAHAFALRFLYYEYSKINSDESAKRISNQIHPGLLKNFRILSEFWNQYRNPFEPYFKKVYNRFLIANGQKKGLKSYNAMVGYLVAYHRENHTLENNEQEKILILD